MTFLAARFFWSFIALGVVWNHRYSGRAFFGNLYHRKLHDIFSARHLGAHLATQILFAHLFFVSCHRRYNLFGLTYPPAITNAAMTNLHDGIILSHRSCMSGTAIVRVISARGDFAQPYFFPHLPPAHLSLVCLVILVLDVVIHLLHSLLLSSFPLYFLSSASSFGHPMRNCLGEYTAISHPMEPNFLLAHIIS